jgi:glycerol-3-phosphate O-acyltransferase
VEAQNVYKQKMAAQLKEWSAQINLLEAKLDNVGADMRVRRAEELHELRAKRNAAAEKVKELGKSTGEAWEQAKVTADKMWADFKAGLTDAQSRFK